MQTGKGMYSIAGVFAIGASPRPCRPAGVTCRDVPSPESTATFLCYTPAGNAGAMPLVSGSQTGNAFTKLLPRSASKTQPKRTHEGLSTSPNANDKDRSAKMRKCGFSIDDILQTATHKSPAPSTPPTARCSPSPEPPGKLPLDNTAPAASATAAEANFEFFARLQSKFYQDLKLSGLQLSALRAGSMTEVFSIPDGVNHVYSTTPASGYYHPPTLSATQHHHASYSHHPPHLHPHRHHHHAHQPMSVPIPVPVYLRGKSPVVSPAEAARVAKKCRRSRTVFTELQLMGLEKRFERQKYLSTPDRLELAENLGLSQLQVKTWYQNRRMKWKKQVMQSGHHEPPTKPKGRPKKCDVIDETLTPTNLYASDLDRDALSDVSDDEVETPVLDVSTNESSELLHLQPLTSSAYSSVSSLHSTSSTT